MYAECPPTCVLFDTMWSQLPAELSATILRQVLVRPSEACCPVAKVLFEMFGVTVECLQKFPIGGFACFDEWDRACRLRHEFTSRIWSTLNSHAQDAHARQLRLEFDSDACFNHHPHFIVLCPCHVPTARMARMLLDAVDVRGEGWDLKPTSPLAFREWLKTPLAQDLYDYSLLSRRYVNHRYRKRWRKASWMDSSSCDSGSGWYESDTQHSYIAIRRCAGTPCRDVVKHSSALRRGHNVVLKGTLTTSDLDYARRLRRQVALTSHLACNVSPACIVPAIHQLRVRRERW